MENVVVGRAKTRGRMRKIGTVAVRKQRRRENKYRLINGSRGSSSSGPAFHWVGGGCRWALFGATPPSGRQPSAAPPPLNPPSPHHQKIRSSAPNFGLFSSLWGSSRRTVAAVQGHGPPKVRVWASLGSFYASPGDLQAAGFHKMTQGKSHFRWAVAAATIPREDPPGRGKRTKFGAEEKKNAKFWALHRSGPHPSWHPLWVGFGSLPLDPLLRAASTLRGSTLLGNTLTFSEKNRSGKDPLCGSVVPRSGGPSGGPVVAVLGVLLHVIFKQTSSKTDITRVVIGHSPSHHA